jgi:hypothetical protein
MFTRKRETSGAEYDRSQDLELADRDTDQFTMPLDLRRAAGREHQIADPGPVAEHGLDQVDRRDCRGAGSKKLLGVGSKRVGHVAS